MTMSIKRNDKNKPGENHISYILKFNLNIYLFSQIIVIITQVGGGTLLNICSVKMKKIPLDLRNKKKSE